MKLLVKTLVCILLGTFIKPSVFAQENPIIGKHYDESITLLPPESNRFFEVSQPEVADINGDGRDDILFSGLGKSVDDPAALVIWVGNDAGIMEEATESLVLGGVPGEERGYRQLIPADFNSDGRLDLFLESHGPELDCGDGSFDCWPGGQNSLLLSDGTGKLMNVTATNLPAYSDFTHGSTVADFDGDGDIDIWVNSGGGSPLYDVGFAYMLFNDGAGKFTVVADNSAPWETEIVGPNGILPETTWISGSWTTAIDVDADGDVDLAVPGGQIEAGPDFVFSNLILRKGGGGRFSILDQEAWPLPNWWQQTGMPEQQPWWGIWGDPLDLDYDGNDDILALVGGESSEGVELESIMFLISNGDGTFRDESESRYQAQQPVELLRSVQVHDLDGDGHPDLFVQERYNGPVRISVNNGEGYFRPLAEDWVVIDDWNWRVLDIDGDGGSDFFLQSDGYVLHRMNLPYGPNLTGDSNSNRLIGGSFNNVFMGMSGSDVLDGGLGDDELNGGPGDDQLIGGKGDDRLIPGPGNNAVDGSPGRDSVEYPFSMDDAEILPDQITLISKQDDSSNDLIENTEYALFSDGATPLPTQAQSVIASLNGVAGLWYDPDLDGEGFNVITTPSGTVIFFYGFNANSERLWLVSETLPDGFDFEQIVDVQMYEGTNGTFNQPAPPPDGLDEWGRLKMLFDGCSTARFALHGGDGMKTTYQIKLAGITNADCQVQSLSAPSGLAGLWYDPTLNGEGYNLIITETVTVVLFYGYAADGQRLWLISATLAGAPIIGETVTLQMFVSTDGTFDEPLASSEVLKDWGELEVTFNSCGTALANLTGDDGEKTSNLEKLAGIDHSTCP